MDSAAVKYMNAASMLLWEVKIVTKTSLLMRPYNNNDIMTPLQGYFAYNIR